MIMNKQNQNVIDYNHIESTVSIEMSATLDCNPHEMVLKT